MTRFLRLALLAGLVAPVTLAAQTPQGRLATGAVRAVDPMRDSAIARLETFLRQYPESEGRAQALFQLGELLVRRADERFAEAQRGAAVAGDTAAAGEAPIKPEYGEAIARYEELVREHEDFDRRAEAAYTLGTLYAGEQRYADAARMFEIVVGQDSARADSAGILAPAYFRLGDARFEIAAAARGNDRRAGFARAAEAYERAVRTADPNGDIYFLSLYKLGWSYYNQANRANQQEYRQAVETFGRLVQAYDQLTPEQQARLGLRSEALEYMAVAFTQVGGAEAANQYFARAGGDEYRRQVIGRVAASLRDQGAFPEAVEAYREYIALAPTDSAALAAQIEIVDIFQNRMIEPEQAQAARLALVERFGPNSEWARANPQLAQLADSAREAALRESAQFLLAAAQQGNRANYAEAAALYERYLQAFPGSDSARAVSAYLGDAYVGQREWMRAGAAFSRAAAGDTSALGELAARNAIVAFDSAVVRARQDRAAQDSLFAAVDRYVAAFPRNDAAKNALRQKGLRASETERWDVLERTFRTYAQLYPNDPYTPTAEKLVADAMYRQGQYAEARVQWDRAEEVARQRGNRALADSIASTRAAAASMFADTLVARGEYRRAAEEVYVAFADAEPRHPEAPDALRNAIETYRIAIDSAGKLGLDETQVRQAKERAADLALRLAQQYPNYQYRRQYQALGAQYLAETGRRDEAVTALRTLIEQNPRWEGRADAMVALASVLDSLNRHAEAAQAYVQFSETFPRDPRAADALYNAAVTYVEAGDSVAAARTYGQFASRFSRDERAAQARAAQVGLLRASGNTEAADAEIARLCRGTVTGDLRATCAEREARRAFEQGAALWDEFRGERLVIASRGQLTQAGVQRASRRKQQLMREMTQQFTRAIQAGNPEYLAAATYHIGLAQWEYGRFLENVELPDELSDEERQAAQQGSSQQAQEFYDAARATWQELLRKAEAEPELGNDPEARAWIDRARRGVEGDVPATPPTAFIDRGAAAGRIG